MTDISMTVAEFLAKAAKAKKLPKGMRGEIQIRDKNLPEGAKLAGVVSPYLAEMMVIEAALTCEADCLLERATRLEGKAIAMRSLIAEQYLKEMTTALSKKHPCVTMAPSGQIIISKKNVDPVAATEEAEIDAL